MSSNADAANGVSRNASLAACVATFVIGLFAGVCAVFIPRLVAMLARERMDDVALVPADYLLLGLSYAAIVGAVVAILYHGKPGSPADRFMTALAVPALIAGALSNSANNAQHSLQLERTARLVDTVAARERVNKVDTPTEIAPLPALAPVPAPGPQSLLEFLLGIRAAYAQAPGGLERSVESRFARSWNPMAEEPRYAIVIDKAATAVAARAQAEKWKARLPQATAVRSGDGFSVITGIKPESSALVEAVRIKRDLKIDTEMLRVK